MREGDVAIQIRPAVESDAPLLLQLIQELAQYEKLLHEVVATEQLLRQHLFGKKPAAEALLAFVGAEPVGYALFFHNFSTFVGKPGIYLEDIYVRPSTRRRAIGKALLRRVAQIAVERQCGRLEWAVLDWNQPAIDFYRKHGAAPMGDWTSYQLTGEALQRLSEGESA